MTLEYPKIKIMNNHKRSVIGVSSVDLCQMSNIKILEQARTGMRDWMSSPVRRDEIWNSMTPELKDFYGVNNGGATNLLDDIVDSFVDTIVDAI